MYIMYYNMQQIYFRFKGSQPGAFCSSAVVHCNLKFKLCFLKSLKLFSVRVKELFKPIVLGKKQWIFPHFKRIFFRNRSLSNARGFWSKTQN